MFFVLKILIDPLPTPLNLFLVLVFKSHPIFTSFITLLTTRMSKDFVLLSKLSPSSKKTLSPSSAPQPCISSHQGKENISPNTPSPSPSPKLLLDKIYTDTTRPLPTSSRGNRYATLFVDQYSGLLRTLPAPHNKLPIPLFFAQSVLFNARSVVQLAATRPMERVNSLQGPLGKF